MNRRKVLGFLVATPVAAVVPELPVVATPEAATTAPLFPLGYLMNTVEYSANPCHMHAYSAMQAVASIVTKIWDGEKFVNQNSAEGTAVMNKVMQWRKGAGAI